ncbi:EF-hand domain-containing protein, partial [Streptomyces ochraceiscleroticus]|uniref:EF-hand domain-containing protein n=1 Tax=Streptomyces ochraceiscleroticus TaxID=47761 RepID=A0ABW1MJW3_9ACTN
MAEALKDRKFKALFEMFDPSGQGYLTRDGFRRFTDAVTGLVPSGDVENATAMRNAFEKWWEILAQSADGKGDSRIEREEFVSIMRSRVTSPGNLEEAVLAIADSLMRALDTSKDGVLSKDEYLRIYTHLGIDAEHCSDAFNRLDRDGNGVISHDEWRTALNEFYLSDDESAPGNWLLGPLTPTRH